MLMKKANVNLYKENDHKHIKRYIPNIKISSGYLCVEKLKVIYFLFMPFCHLQIFFSENFLVL